MGSGLILAGIGKGISDASSIYGNAMFKMAEAEYADQRALQRQEALDEIRRQRTIKDTVAAEAEAGRIAAARSETQLTADSSKIAGVASQVKGASPAMSQEEIKQLMQENPQYAETYRKAGLIDKGMTLDQQRVQAADDRVQGALKIGAHSTVVEAFQKARKDVLDQIREENKERRELTRLEQTDRRLNLMEERITSQNKTDNIRANKPSGGGSGGGGITVRKTTTDDQGNVVAIMSDGTTKDLGIKSGDYNNKISKLISDREKNDYQFKQLPEAEKKAWAATRYSSQTSAKPSDNSANRPALDSFRR